MEIEVKGHSGCLVDVVREEKRLLVEKKTFDKDYADRLYQQAEKQKKAACLLLPGIRVPHILEIRHSPEACCIRMEYIYSKNFIDFFESAGFEQVISFTQTIKNLIDFEVGCCREEIVSPIVFEQKFESVKRNISNSERLSSDMEIRELLKGAEMLFRSLVEKNPRGFLLPVGLCHGDLTLSNILFNGNDCFLIDFLDSFVETPLMDIVKIRQDTVYQWSVLMYEGRSFDRNRFSIVVDKIDREICDYFKNRYTWFEPFYGIFQLMNFLRILQYAKEERVIVFLKQIINKQLEK